MSGRGPCEIVTIAAGDGIANAWRSRSLRMRALRGGATALLPCGDAGEVTIPTTSSIPFFLQKRFSAVHFMIEMSVRASQLDDVIYRITISS